MIATRGGRCGVTEFGCRIGRGGARFRVQQADAQCVQLRPDFTQGQWRVDMHFDFFLYLQRGFEGCLSAASVLIVLGLLRFGSG